MTEADLNVCCTADMEAHTQWNSLPWSWPHCVFDLIGSVIPETLTLNAMEKCTTLGMTSAKRKKKKIGIREDLMCCDRSCDTHTFILSGPFLCRFVSSSVSEPCWWCQHFHCIPQHQPLHCHEVWGEAEVLTSSQNQNPVTTYRYVNVMT